MTANISGTSGTTEISGTFYFANALLNITGNGGVVNIGSQYISRLLTLGGNMSIAAGPVGRSADAATNVRLDAQILAYSRAKGLFAGATFEGAALHANDSANKAFYGRELKLREILYASEPATTLPSIAATWRSTLSSLTSGK